MSENPCYGYRQAKPCWREGRGSVIRRYGKNGKAGWKIARAAGKIAVDRLEPRVLLSSIVVNTTRDDGPFPPSSGLVSLRDAIESAVGSTTISFDPKVFAIHQTIKLRDQRLRMSGGFPIAIEGPAEGVTLDAQGQDGDFVIYQGVVSMSHISIINCGAPAIYSHGQLTLTDVVLSKSSGDPDGGGLFNDGTATLVNVTISNNNAARGGGIENHGILSLTNVTLSGNSGGAIFNAGTGVIALTNVTIANNIAPMNGGGISNPWGSVTIANSIIADNSAMSPNANAPDIAGTVHSQGHNVVGIADGSYGLLKSDFKGTSAAPLDARLSPLGNYGGSMQTIVPLGGSPASGDGAISLLPADITTDQRTTRGGFTSDE